MSSLVWRTRWLAKPDHARSRGYRRLAEEPNVHVTLAECVYGSRGYNLADLAGARVTHIPLRATTMAWSKECLLNIAISRLPPGAEKIATSTLT
jgi:hypothetical protein